MDIYVKMNENVKNYTGLNSISNSILISAVHQKTGVNTISWSDNLDTITYIILVAILILLNLEKNPCLRSKCRDFCHFFYNTLSLYQYGQVTLKNFFFFIIESR